MIAAEKPESSSLKLLFEDDELGLVIVQRVERKEPQRRQ